jgi:cobalt-zinc-cadmium efflux system outer membrane protein
LAEAQRAARQNFDVSLAARAIASARADVESADHAPVPVLSAKAASIDLQHGIGAGNLFAEKRVEKAVGVDWTWERGNKRELRTRTARRAAQAAQADWEEVAVQQQIAAASAWYDLFAAQQRFAQVEAIERSAAQLSAAAQRRVGAGDLSRQDASRIEIESERARADLRGAAADRYKAALVLGQITGLPPAMEAQGAWPAAGAVEPASPAAETRADVRAAALRVEAARAALDSARAQREADVTLGAALGHFPGTSSRQLELRLQVPLVGVLGLYANQGEIGRAQAQFEQASDQLEKTRRGAAVEAGRLQQELQAASARALAYETSIAPRARQVAEMAELAYGKGATSLTELIDAQRTLRTVQLEDIAAHADYGRALAAAQLRAGSAAIP